MAKNYQGDKEYLEEVRARGGHRSEKDYDRFLARKEAEAQAEYEREKAEFKKEYYKLSDKTREYLEYEDIQVINNLIWKDSRGNEHENFIEEAIEYGCLYRHASNNNKYEGFLVDTGKISKQQYAEIKDLIEKTPFKKICLIDNDMDYQHTSGNVISWIWESFVSLVKAFIISVIVAVVIVLLPFIPEMLGTILFFVIMGCDLLLIISDFPMFLQKRNFAVLKYVLREEVLKKNPQQLTPVLTKLEAVYKEAIENITDEKDIRRIILNYEYNMLQIEDMKKTYMPDEKEEILLAYDATSANLFTKGLLLTDKKLYFHDFFKFKKISIGLSEIKNIERKNKIFSLIKINNHSLLVPSEKSDFPKALCELLKNAISVLQEEKENVLEN